MSTWGIGKPYWSYLSDLRILGGLRKAPTTGATLAATAAAALMLVSDSVEWFLVEPVRARFRGLTDRGHCFAGGFDLLLPYIHNSFTVIFCSCLVVLLSHFRSLLFLYFFSDGLDCNGTLSAADMGRDHCAVTA